MSNSQCRPPRPWWEDRRPARAAGGHRKPAHLAALQQRRTGGGIDNWKSISPLNISGSDDIEVL